MAWSKVDDQLHSHPKVQEAWHADKASLGLHLLAMSYAGCHLTDGFVPEAFVQTHLPKKPERERAMRALLSSGLWEDHVEGGFWIHDYLNYNDSRVDVLARRRAESDRKRNGRKVEA